MNSYRTRVGGVILAAAFWMLLYLGRRSSIHQISFMALAMSTTTGSTAKQKQQRLHRVLCYGDSLTAGTTTGFVEHPYAPHLQAGLGDNVVVRHIGLPGWTVSSMIDELDGSAGLRTAIQAIRDPPLSLVILLAGTNDLGYGFTAEEITSNLLQMHRFAWESGIPRTIAIGIPPSGYQSVNEPARQLAAQVSENLDAASKSNPLTYVPFPFAYERGGDNWDGDGLHFSPKGYQVLGESLVQVVKRVLEDLDHSQHSTV